MFQTSSSPLTAKPSSNRPSFELWAAAQGFLTNDLFIMAVLSILNLVCFYRSLHGYFLADDFVHIPYLYQVFHGHSELLWQNFYSNWMQSQGTTFYRPLISMTLAFDYLLWGANPLGYHLTNTLYQIACSIFLFLLSRRLLLRFGHGQATGAAFFAGALFAVYPLHGEVVNWVIGRVDSVCVAFYLGAMFALVKGAQDKSPLATTMGLVLFILSLMSKEMAVTLPPTLTLFFLCNQSEQHQPIARLKGAIAQSWQAWSVLGGYLILRVLFLGTVAGGYSGSIGEGLGSSFYQRWIANGSLLRLLLPFNDELFFAGDRWRKLLRTAYLACSSFVLARLIFCSTPKLKLPPQILFAAGWFILSILPTYQVWDLTVNLHGSRFAYLSSAPLCLLIALVIFPLFDPEQKNLHNPRIWQTTACILLSLIIYCFIGTTLRNNLPWIHASSEVRALRESLETELNRLGPGKQLVLMNLPQETQGAHMLYNAAMLSCLMSEPLSPGNLSSQIATFEPMTYGDSNLLVISRLRKIINHPDVYSVYRWDETSNSLRPLHLVPSTKEIKLDLGPDGHAVSNLNSQQLLVSPNLDLPSTATDFVDVEMSASSKIPALSAIQPLELVWSPDTSKQFASCLRQTIKTDGKKHTYRFNVSQYKNWTLSENIEKIALRFPAGPITYKLYKVEFVNGAHEIPKLESDPKSIMNSPDGDAYFKGSSGNFLYDASGIKGATKVIFEISKPNAWFEHYSGELRDHELSSNSLSTWVLDRIRGNFHLEAAVLPRAAYYQLRMAALSSDGKIIGYVSDPINLQVAAVQIEESKSSSGDHNAK